MLDFIQNNPNLLTQLLNGLKYTLIISFLSALFGIILGIIIALFKGSKRKPIKVFADIYTDIFRGTPVILQVSIIYYVVFGLFDVNPVFAAVFSLSLNSGAYVSEIIRSGIDNVDKGQIEAARSMGVREKDIILDIIIPLAIKKTLPALVNEIASLIKESSIVYIIGVEDIMHLQHQITSNQYLYFEPLITVGICYYLLVKTVTKFGKYLEVKFND